MSDENTMFATVHYILTVIFFIIVLISCLALLKVTYNMEPVDSDTEKAKQLMYSASIIGLLSELLILIFVIFTYMYSSSKNERTISYYDKLLGNTGTENLFAAMRIVSFSR